MTPVSIPSVPVSFQKILFFNCLFSIFIQMTLWDSTVTKTKLIPWNNRFCHFSQWHHHSLRIELLESSWMPRLLYSSKVTIYCPFTFKVSFTAILFFPFLLPLLLLRLCINSLLCLLLQALQELVYSSSMSPCAFYSPFPLYQGSRVTVSVMG